MSKADDMFNKLDYQVEEGKRNIFVYTPDDYQSKFVFHKESQSSTIYKMLVNKKELQAINEKVKELGWYE